MSVGGVKRIIFRARRESACAVCGLPIHPGQLGEILRRGVFAHTSHQKHSRPADVADDVTEQHRALFRKVPCPACGAGAGAYCREDGQLRATNHRERVRWYTQVKRRRRATATVGTR